jgi:hypothetical protein
MKLPRRKFLHLAAAAVALPAVSRFSARYAPAIRFARKICQAQAFRRYDAASATHAGKRLIIGELDRENGYGCR